MTDAEILEKLRAYFQNQINNLNATEMAEGPFEDETEDGELWEQAASRIDARGGLRIRFEFADGQHGDLQAENRKLREQVAAQEQVLEIVRAQTNDCVEKVDVALGHRYHRPGVHYSVPHVAEKAAAELKQLQARLDAALAVCDRYDPGLFPLAHVRAAAQGDQPTEPPRRRPLLVAPDDPCQDERCSRIDGRCVGSHCGRCNKPSSSQGHYTSFCSNSKGGTKHHFCCPNDCELAAEPTGEADRG